MTSAVLGRIDRDGRLPGPTDEESATLALFVGLQMARTTEAREGVLFPLRVVEWAAGREVTQELVAEYLETKHLGFKPSAPEVDGAWTFVTVAVRTAPETLSEAFAARMMLENAWELSRRLLALNWAIEIDPRHGFITSDSPVVTWREPSVRDNFQGVGIMTADEVRLPLDPGKQVVFSPRRRHRPVMEVAVHRVRRSNADMAGACHRFILGSPANRPQIDGQRLHEWRPVIRFNVGPGYQKGPDGQEHLMPGEIVHMWKPTRAGRVRPRHRRSGSNDESE